MRGNTHLLFGTMTSITTACFITEKPLLGITMIASSAFFSLFPDIDIPQSKIGRTFPELSTKINEKWGHRTLFHSPFLLLLISLCAFILYHYYPIPYLLFGIYGMILGWGGHLLLDSFTRAGIPFFYPLFNKSKGLTPIRSGSKLEYVFSILTVGICSYMIFAKLQSVGFISNVTTAIIKFIG